MKTISAFMLAVMLAAVPAFAQHRGGGHAGVVRGPVYSIHAHVGGFGVWRGYPVTYPYGYRHYDPHSFYYGYPYPYYGYPYYTRPYYRYPYAYYYGYPYPYFVYPYAYGY